MNLTARRIASLLWPAFLMAGAVQALVFAHVDPDGLHSLSGGPLELSPMAVQSLAFLAFWAAIVAAGAMTRWMDHHDAD